MLEKTLKMATGYKNSSFFQRAINSFFHEKFLPYNAICPKSRLLFVIMYDVLPKKMVIYGKKMSKKDEELGK